jgi:cysteine desulfurase/selenocysteine lyase
MADAFEYVKKVGLNDILQHDRNLMRLVNQLLGNVNVIKIYGPSIECHTNIFAFNIENMDSAEIVMILDSTNNIKVRSGHRCAQVNTNKVLGEAKGVVKVSTYFYNTERDITIFAKVVKDIVDTMVS